MKNYSIILGWLVTLFLLLTTTTGQAGPSSEQPQDVKTDSALIELKPLGKDEAVDLTISFGIKPVIGMMYQKYEKGTFKISDNIPLFRGGVSLYYNNFFGDLYYQKSDKGYESQFVHKDQKHSFDEEDRNEFKRKDYAVSAGYLLPSYFNILAPYFNILRGGQFAIFGGYKVGQIDVDSRTLLLDVPQSTGTQTMIQEYRINFKTKGPSVGAFYVLPIGDTTNVRINFAWAWLKGNYHNLLYNKDGLVKEYPLTSNPTDGRTYGVELNGYLTSHVKYSVGVDYFKYTMKMIEPTEKYRNDGSKYTDFTDTSITEDLATLKAALVYEF